MQKEKKKETNNFKIHREGKDFFRVVIPFNDDSALPIWIKFKNGKIKPCAEADWLIYKALSQNTKNRIWKVCAKMHQD